MLKGIFIISGICISITLSAATIFVTESGSGTMDGSNWQNAINGANLQTAINNATLGDNIWVACGTYFPSAMGDRSASFSMRNGISIFGSFQGTESSIEERVFSCGPCSILSGNIGNLAFEFDNTYTVIVNNGLDNSAVIDGFEVRDGYDDRSISSVENGLGGGIYNGGHGGNGSCSPTFRNMVIINNFAGYGAGMFNNGYDGGHSAPVLINCIIANNTATIGGGGMDSYGWRNGDVAPVLTNCIFYENVSQDRAGAMYCWGGLNGNCSPTITNCAFVNNTSTNIAGGIIVDNSDNLAGNPPFSGTAEVTFMNSIAWGNTSNAGPQFYILGNGNFNASFSNIDTVGQTNAHPISGSGQGNLFSNPLFNDIGDGIGVDGCWMTADDGLNLSIASANINAGNEPISISTDLTLNNRFSGASIDIGPYEYQLLSTVIWTGSSSSSWSVDENWLPTRVPDSTQQVTIPALMSNYPVIQDTIVTIPALLLENDSEIQLLGTGVLNVNGN